MSSHAAQGSSALNQKVARGSQVIFGTAIVISKMAEPFLNNKFAFEDMPDLTELSVPARKQRRIPGAVEQDWNLVIPVWLMGSLGLGQWQRVV